jgi:hypothetical protein
VVGLGALAAAAAAAFSPVHGHYAGPGGGHQVAFHYAHQELVGFTLGSVHACPQAWVGQDHGFTCHHNGKFVIGHWTSETDVKGDYVYTRQTSRGSVRITVQWTAHQTG